MLCLACLSCMTIRKLAKHLEWQLIIIIPWQPGLRGLSMEWVTFQVSLLGRSPALQYLSDDLVDKLSWADQTRNCSQDPTSTLSICQFLLVDVANRYPTIRNTERRNSTGSVHYIIIYSSFIECTYDLAHLRSSCTMSYTWLSWPNTVSGLLGCGWSYSKEAMVFGSDRSEADPFKQCAPPVCKDLKLFPNRMRGT